MWSHKDSRRPPIGPGASIGLLLAAAISSACGAEASGGVGGMAGGTYKGPSSSEPGASAGKVEGSGADDGGGGQSAVPAGKLTAGEWDDNLNFPLFSAWAAATAAGGVLPEAPVKGRVLIEVVDEAGAPVPGARVIVQAGQLTLLDAPAGTDGRLLFLPAVDAPGQVTATSVRVEPPPGIDGPALETSVPSGGIWTLKLKVKSAPTAKIDVAFVFDATGSMADEMAWLKAEIGAIASWVKARHDGLSLRLGLVVYRDVGDTYVVRSFDFMESVDGFLVELGKQSAGGGGDYPEAMERGLEAMNDLGWRGGNAARVAFLVADAPPHDHHLKVALAQALTARKKGIRLYSLAASGAGKTTEYMMRTMAMVTLARYLFLTDDSGIGASHAEPSVPCYHVLLLENLLRRTLDAEVLGKRYPPEASEIIRSVGDPQQGVCKLENGKLAYL